jgi:anti-anti-sigma factor
VGDVNIVRNGAQARVTLQAGLTGAEVPAIQAALLRELDAGVRSLVFDMKATRILDSMGVSLLLATLSGVSARGGAISLEDVAPEVLQPLRILGLAHRLHAQPAGVAHG